MGQSSSSPSSQSVSATPNPPTTSATVAAAVAHAKQQQQQQQSQQSPSIISSITSYFSQTPTELYGTKIDVKPLASVDGAKGPVSYRAVVDTPQQAEELKQMRIARLTCRDEQLLTLDGNKWMLLGGLSGGMLSVLAPNQWSLKVRSAPYMIATVCGIMIDRVQWNKKCDQRHPLPRWYIENMVPVSQLEQANEEMSEELARTISEMQQAENKKGK